MPKLYACILQIYKVKYQLTSQIITHFVTNILCSQQKKSSVCKIGKMFDDVKARSNTARSASFDYRAIVAKF